MPNQFLLNSLNSLRAKLNTLSKSKAADKKGSPESSGETLASVLAKFDSEGPKEWTTKRDYEVDFVNQGNIGDCYYLAALANSKLRKQADCLRWNDDGSADVFLFPQVEDGQFIPVRETYHITKEELESESYDAINQNYENQKIKFGKNQDLTLKALEIGAIKSCGNRADILTGGNVLTIAAMLFGTEDEVPGEGILTSVNIADLEDLNITKEDLGKSISLGFHEETGQEIEIGGRTLMTNHAYIFNSINDDGTVSVSNPHNDNRHDTSDDIILSLEDLKKTKARLQIIMPKDDSAKYHALNVKNKLWKKDLNGALEELNKAIEKDSGNSFYYRLRAALKIRNNDNEGALEDLTEALGLHPENVTLYFDKYNLKLQNSDFDGAMEALEQALQYEPNNAMIYKKMVYVRKCARDNDGYIKDLVRATEADEECSVAKDEINSFIQKKEYKKAVALCRELLKRFPDSPPLLEQLEQTKKLLNDQNIQEQ